MTPILEVFISNMISRLYEAGITDPTHEDISCQYGRNKIKFRLYSQEQWDNMIANQNTAVRLYAQLNIGTQPDAVITHKDKVYLVRLIK